MHRAIILSFLSLLVFMSTKSYASRKYQENLYSEKKMLKQSKEYGRTHWEGEKFKFKRFSKILKNRFKRAMKDTFRGLAPCSATGNGLIATLRCWRHNIPLGLPPSTKMSMIVSTMKSNPRLATLFCESVCTQGPRSRPLLAKNAQSTASLVYHDTVISWLDNGVQVNMQHTQPAVEKFKEDLEQTAEEYYDGAEISEDEVKSALCSLAEDGDAEPVSTAGGDIDVSQWLFAKLQQYNMLDPQVIHSHELQSGTVRRAGITGPGAEPAPVSENADERTVVNAIGQDIMQDVRIACSTICPHSSFLVDTLRASTPSFSDAELIDACKVSTEDLSDLKWSKPWIKAPLNLSQAAAQSAPNLGGVSSLTRQSLHGASQARRLGGGIASRGRGFGQGGFGQGLGMRGMGGFA